MEPGEKIPLEPIGCRRHCPVFGVANGAPIIGLGLVIIMFGGALLLTGPSPPVTLPPALLFIGFQCSPCRFGHPEMM